MGLFSTFKKALGIAEMKADEALNDSLSPIDKAKYNIKQKKDKLASAQKSFDKANTAYYTERNKLNKLVNTGKALNAKKDEIILAMKGFQAKGMDAAAVKAKVGPAFTEISSQITENASLVQTQTSIKEGHEKTVTKFKEMIKIYKKEVLKDENEFKLLESQYNMADTSSAIANAMNELNADGSSDDIAQLRAKQEIKQAEADALIDNIQSNENVMDSIDSLLLESSSSNPTSELDMLLAGPETPVLPQ